MRKLSHAHQITALLLILILTGITFMLTLLKAQNDIKDFAEECNAHWRDLIADECPQLIDPAIINPFVAVPPTFLNLTKVKAG